VHPGGVQVAHRDLEPLSLGADHRLRVGDSKDSSQVFHPWYPILRIGVPRTPPGSCPRCFGIMKHEIPRAFRDGSVGEVRAKTCR
jgi:hypothetical protein